MRDVVLFFFQRVQIHNLAGNLPVFNFCIRGFNNSEIIYFGIGGKMKNKPDVRAFRSMNRTDSSVVRRMHIAHLQSGALTSKTSGSQGGESAQMLYFIKYIFLRHELRKLVSGKKFLDAGL